MNRKPLLLVGLSLTGLLMTLLLLVGLGTAVAEPAPTNLPLIADFEGGIPAGFVGFADSWDGSGSATTLALGTTQLDLPVSPPVTETTAVSVTYFVDPFIPWGFPGYAGVTHDFATPQDWDGYQGFSFWFHGSGSSGAHRIELKSTGASPANSNRYEYTFTDDVDGWKYVNVPFSDFTRRFDFNPGPSPDDPINLGNMWGYSILLAPGAGGTFQMDNVMLTKRHTIHDFEGGIPAGFVGFADSWDGSGSTTTLAYATTTTDLPTVPPITGTTAVSATYFVDPFIPWGFPGYAGLTYDAPAAEDWSEYDSFSFWFYGSGSGGDHRIELKADGAAPANANRYEYTFTDAAAGWTWFNVPFSDFAPRTDFNPGPSPSDPINLGKMWGYSILLAPGTGGSFLLDEVALYGRPVTERKVSLAEDAYAVEEGGLVEITAVLNLTHTEPITVTYATSNGSATAGSDYSNSNGTLVFPAGSSTQTITVATTDDSDEEDDESFTLTLSSPENAVLGNKLAATITILDNDAQPLSGKAVIIDDFESGLPSGTDGDGIAIGFITWNHPSASVAITTTANVPAPVPGSQEGNHVLQETLTIGTGQWAGFTHAFTNDTADQWVPQDWSTYQGMSFWLYGRNTGGVLFVDILDNRTPGSTSDDAERWSIDVPDDFEGWRLVQLRFEDFHRKEIGNGAPNDGFNLTAVHGYAIGGFGSVDMGTQDFFIDNVGLIVRTTVIDDFENNSLPAGQDSDGVGVGYITWNHPSASAVITTTTTPPVPVPDSEAGNTVLQETLTVGTGQWAGFTHAFTNATADQWLSQDWSSYEGICFWLYGNNTGGVLFVDILDNRNPGSTSDDAERWSVDIPDNFAGWQLIQIPFADFHRKEIGNGAPNDGLNLTEVHGYAIGGFGSVDMGTQDYYIDDVAIYGNTGTEPKPLEVAFAAASFTVGEGKTAVITASLTTTSTETVTVDYRTAESNAIADRDYLPTSGTLTFAPGETEKSFTVETLDDSKHSGDLGVMVNLANATNANLGFVRRALLTIVDDEAANPLLLDDFEGWHPFATSGMVELTVTEVAAGTSLALPYQDAYEQVLTVDYDTTGGSAGLERTFANGQDWSGQDGLGFWFYGSNSGQTMTVNLLDNQAANTSDVAAEDWVMVWSDEFDEAAGTPPNPNVWTHEIGDGSLNGIIGWGNSESQFYTNSPDNAATDGNGNMVISLLKEDPATNDLLCWYGPCEYTSARLISWHKAEFEYGRIEARVLVPPGEGGLWPAFWALGTDIGEVDWPQSGEIDIMEYVSRIPNEVFGTLHGPGYSGGQSFGNTYDLGEPVANNYHTFTIEWGPDEIHWFVDGINYHNAIPADVAPNEWVYNHDFFLLLNMAIGGNFGGTIDENIVFPQEMKVDYVRVYQAADTAERFEATFVDDFTGWRKINIPFEAFSRSTSQPAGAPDDGLTLTEVWGYGFTMPEGSTGNFHLDQVRLFEITQMYMPVVRR